MENQTDFKPEINFPNYLVGLSGLYKDLFSSAKGFRSQIVVQVSKSLGLDKESIELLQKTVEFLHSASLLHDDFIDRSQLRRNKTAAWLKYNPESAVLGGDYLVITVFKDLCSYGNLELAHYMTEKALDLIEGEWIQNTAVSSSQFSLDDLDKIYDLKTSSLFKWCLSAPFICKKNFKPELQEKLEQFGSVIGILFQRGDDLLDFDIRNAENKVILSDLKSGYMNSFGRFLFERISEDKRDSFLECKSMEEIYSLVEKKQFQEILKMFDNLNEELIQKGLLCLKEVNHLLGEEHKDLISYLGDIPKLMYWRKI